MMSAPSCGACIYWRLSLAIRGDDPRGQCRLYPPHLFKRTETFASDWCGKGKFRTPTGVKALEELPQPTIPAEEQMDLFPAGKKAQA